MAQLDTNAGTATGTVFGRVLSHIGQFFVDVADAQSRSRQVEALNDLTDEELDQIGLKRWEIAQHVFRDKLFM